MRGHALYLRDDNGGPHEAPRPRRKFSEHWARVHRARVAAVLDALPAGVAAEVRASLKMELVQLGLACGDSNSEATKRATRLRITLEPVEEADEAAAA